jgi:hypothetical protein
MSGGTVRVLDATGKAIASGKPVAATTGAYGPITLTGSGPFRVEACGSVGGRALCAWGATTTGGTLDLTPLTSAVTVLAGGQAPAALMSGAVQGLADSALATAQAQLRTALAPALADAGLASGFDLLAGALTPGSHTGYDRLLDAVSVGLGMDSKAYVTLNAELGGGLAYLEPGTTQGSLSVNAASTTVDFPGVDSLYTALGAVLPNANTCTTGLPALLDANARSSVSLVTTAFVGPAQAKDPLCTHMLGLLDGDIESLVGSTLLPAVPRHCDFSAADPVCRVSLIFQTAKGLLRQVGVEQAVVKRSGTWKFLGNRLEVQASAAARLVLARRADQTAADVYTRWLDIAIPAYPGLQCAHVSQKDTNAADVVLALFKPAGSNSLLSLWSASDGTPSLDPANGAVRVSDPTSLALPGSTAGDATARNFVRAGRALKVELFSDAACSTPLPGADGGAVSIDVSGTLPAGAAGMSGLPWPALAAKSVTALVALTGASGGKIAFAPAWITSPASLAVNRARLCGDAACGLLISDLELTGNATTAKLDTTLGVLGLAASDYKLLRITGRTSDGLAMQLDTLSCPAQPAGQPC